MEIYYTKNIYLIKILIGKPYEKNRNEGKQVNYFFENTTKVASLKTSQKNEL